VSKAGGSSTTKLDAPRWRREDGRISWKSSAKSVNRGNLGAQRAVEEWKKKNAQSLKPRDLRGPRVACAAAGIPENPYKQRA
jgi:hypothetical protein